MIGPDRTDKGGVATVVNQYFNSKLMDACDVRYIKTCAHGNILAKLSTFLRALILILYWARKADIVHIHMASRGSFKRKYVISLICKKFDLPYIIHLHGAEFQVFYGNECNDRTKTKIKRIFEDAACVIALSEHWKEFIIKIAPSAKCQVIYNSVPLASEKYNYDNQNILFLGRVGDRKGIYDLIDAMSQLDNSHLHIYVGGDGDIKKAQAITYKKNVSEQFHFCGWIDEKQKEELFDLCSVFILPSYNEGLPMALLEAMSHGLAVITTNVGGIPSVIMNMVNGLMLPPGDVEALAKAINDVDNELALKQKLGKNARKSIIDRFSIDIHIEELIKIYNELIHQKAD